MYKQVILAQILLEKHILRWQNRHPRVHPLRISTVNLSCTESGKFRGSFDITCSNNQGLTIIMAKSTSFHVRY